MARKKPKTKAGKKAKFAKVMREGYAGTLHSGSESGPIAKKVSQMKAIAASESGTSYKDKMKKSLAHAGKSRKKDGVSRKVGKALS